MFECLGNPLFSPVLFKTQYIRNWPGALALQDGPDLD